VSDGEAADLLAKPLKDFAAHPMAKPPIRNCRPLGTGGTKHVNADDAACDNMGKTTRVIRHARARFRYRLWVGNPVVSARQDNFAGPAIVQIYVLELQD